MPQRDAIESGREHEAEQSTVLGQHVGCDLRHSIELGIDERAIEFATLVLIEIRRVKQAVDEQAKPALGRNATGRRMRLIDQPQFGELGQRLANARRRQFERQKLREHLRTNGRGRAHVGHHQRTQNAFLAFAEIGLEGPIQRGCVRIRGHRNPQ